METMTTPAAELIAKIETAIRSDSLPFHKLEIARATLRNLRALEYRYLAAVAEEAGALHDIGL
jgi:hypothetical protein